MFGVFLLTDGPHETFAAGSEQYRITRCHDCSQAGHQFEIVLAPLAKANAGIQYDVFRPDTQTFSLSGPIQQIIPNFGGGLLITGVILHGFGVPTLTVHQNHRAVAAGQQGQHGRIIRGRRHIVDNIDTLGQCRICHFAPGGVDTQQASGRQVCPQCPDNRQNPLQLHRCRYRIGTGPGRFAADVEQISPLGQQRPGLFQGGFGCQKSPAIGKAVRGDVEYPHDEGAGILQTLLKGCARHVSPPGYGESNDTTPRIPWPGFQPGVA